MLTDAKIRGLRPDKKIIRVLDSDGLYIEVRPNGSKHWRYRFQWCGKATMMGLGEYLANREGKTIGVSLADARAKRDEQKALLNAGINPIVQGRMSKATTFRAVAEEYLADLKKSVTKTVHRARVLYLEREVFPLLGDMPIADIKPAHVLPIVRRISEKRPVSARFVQQIIGAVCRYAIVTLRMESDPTQPLRGALAPHVVHHHSIMGEADIKAFYEALSASEAYPDILLAAEVLWLTVVRSCELIGAKWSEFDFEHGVWVIPAARMKMRREHLVPLTPRTVELLQALKVLAKSSPYVLPQRGDRSKHAGAGILSRLWNRTTGAKFTPHGVRGTFSTWAHDSGFDTLWIEGQLAHKDKNAVREAYNRSKYLDQRRAMLEQWAAHLEVVKAGGKVVPFKRKAG